MWEGCDLLGGEAADCEVQEVAEVELAGMM